jgi:hypothetical protein
MLAMVEEEETFWVLSLRGDDVNSFDGLTSEIDHSSTGSSSRLQAVMSSNEPIMRRH